MDTDGKAANEVMEQDSPGAPGLSTGRAGGKAIDPMPVASTTDGRKNRTMELAEALHHAARQYCIERANLWHNRYAELQAAGGATVPIRGGNRDYTREAFDIFPRYQIFAA